PPASAWYVVEVGNSTPHQLLVTVTLLNDRRFEVSGPVNDFNQRMMGRAIATENILNPGELKRFYLPSSEDPHIGLLELRAITAAQDSGNIGRRQKIALMIIPWTDLGPG